jgi:hypothetical protein
MKKLFPLFLLLMFIIGCATAQTVGPGQLATKVMETRTLSIPYDRAYAAATNAFFAIGYTLKHTDKASGVIVGERSDSGAGKKAALILLFGLPGALINTKTNYDLTVMLTKDAPAITTIRIGASKNGEPVINKEITDKFWTIVEREAMVDEPVAKSAESKNKGQGILSVKGEQQKSTPQTVATSPKTQEPNQNK